MTILVTGASGYVGGRLVPALLRRGDQVRCLTRDADRLTAAPWRDQVHTVVGDVADRDAAWAALHGVDVAFYLVHAMSDGAEFSAAEAEQAAVFAAAAADCGVRRIVYLGGLVHDDGSELSEHMASRTAVAQILAATAVPVTVLRASVIIGSGSASFELLRHLSERLPVVLAPAELNSRVQPVAIGDVLHYLLAAADDTEPGSRVLDIGGTEVLTYLDLLHRCGAAAGRARLVLPVPAPDLGGLAGLAGSVVGEVAGLLSPVPRSLTRPLAESLRHDSVCGPDTALDRFGAPPGGVTPMAEAFALALADNDSVEVGATPAGPADTQPTDPDWAGGVRYRDERTVPLTAAPEQVWSAVRTFAERSGWRAEGTASATTFRLRNRTPMPGTAWLVYELDAAAGTCTQRLVFRPHGLLGEVWWRATAAPRTALCLASLRWIAAMAS